MDSTGNCTSEKPDKEKCPYEYMKGVDLVIGKVYYDSWMHQRVRFCRWDKSGKPVFEDEDIDPYSDHAIFGVYYIVQWKERIEEIADDRKS